MAEKDTVLTSMESRDANLGGNDTLAFYAADGGQRTALIQFDVSALNTTEVTNAVVQLKQLDGEYDDDPLQISVYAVAAEWTEGNGGTHGLVPAMELPGTPPPTRRTGPHQGEISTEPRTLAMGRTD